MSVKSGPKPITADEMRALEARAMASGAVSGRALMERAGEGVVAAIYKEWPGFSSPRAAPWEAEILCGPGNNGGDGFVIARLLHVRGWTVRVYLFGDAAKLPPDAQANYGAWKALGDVRDARELMDSDNRVQPHLYVDALFGLGLKRPIADPVLWEWLWLVDDCIDAREAEGTRAGAEDFSAPPRTVAVDIPSGLDADTGAVLGTAEHGLTCAAVELTVTFHRPKWGHLRGQGPEMCGALRVVDIGL